MDRLPCMVVYFSQIVHLGVAVVAGRDAVIRFGAQDLVGLGLAVSPTLFLESGLEISAASAAAEVIGAVGLHIDEIFFTHHGFHNISQILGNRVAKGFSDQLAGVLNRKFDFSFLVPIG